MSGKSNLQYDLLSEFFESAERKRPLIMKHFCFWRQKRSVFSEYWMMHPRQKGFFPKTDVENLSLSLSRSVLRSRRCASASLILVPASFCFFCFSFFLFWSFVMRCSPELPGNGAGSTSGEPSELCTSEAAASVVGRRSFNPSGTERSPFVILSSQ